MKTKFILHGGLIGGINSYSDLFFKEILKDAPENPNVLLVLFAKEADAAPTSKARDMADFEKNSGGKKIIFQEADEKNFTEQLKSADVVYFHGGSTAKLLKALQVFPNLKDSLGGKIVAGESAGVYVLSTLFYSKTMGGLFAGLGIIPVKTICHYTGENKEELTGNDNLEILLLADDQFKIFESVVKS